MAIPTLVVSNPPHGEVDVEAAARLLGLDTFATGVKVRFAAPEIMSASRPEEAADFAGALRATGLRVSILPGEALAELPWPDPVANLVTDVSSLRATVGGDAISIPYDAEVVAVYCSPPADWPMPTTDVERAIVSGHGPTIAQAIHRRAVFDLYFSDAGQLRRVTLVPDLMRLDASRIRKELVARFENLWLDERLVGIRPRAPYAAGETRHGGERRRYSFGTLMLREVLESIAPELRAIPQFEFASRLAYALHPLGGTSQPSLGE